MTKLQLVLLIHGHQPVGNFDSVFEKIHQRCYLPFVEVLARHPKIRMGLHYSGPLLEWFEERHPEFLDQLGKMARSGQIELVGGGFYEPILISLPPEDQVEQLHRLRDYLQRRFGAAPTGAWLTERVWEPQLPHELSLGNVGYTLLDDSHFLAAGFAPDRLHGDYIAEDRGRTVRVIPGLQELRYLIPFRPVEDCVHFLRDLATRQPGALAAMGDDCEKFGAWPGTYDHCYRDGWLDKFFTALEGAADWLETATPGAYIAAHTPLGRADLPTASYSEMMEWVLPTAPRKQFHALHAEFAGRPDVERFLRGGHWRGFFGKYSEVNLLHKKMLHVSRLLGGLAGNASSKDKKARLAAARTHLLRAQCNDTYWHGIFGGLYAPHLRTEPWRELVRAESIADELAGGDAKTIRIERFDFNADGRDELYATSRRMAVLIEPAEGGTVSAIDFRTQSVTVINSLQRRLEAYHSRLSEAAQGDAGKVASIHDQMRVKEPGLEKLLRYDRWPRHCFRVLAFAPGKTFADYQELRLDEDAALAGGTFTAGETGPATVTLKSEQDAAASGMAVSCSKRFTFSHTPDGFSIHCATEIKTGANAPAAQVGIEMVLNFLAPDEGDRYFEVGGEKHRLRWTAAVKATELRSAPLRIADEWQDVAATIEAPGAEAFWIAPIDTVSESEEGFERVYQGSQILAVWPAGLPANSVWRGEVTLKIAPARTAKR